MEVTFRSTAGSASIKTALARLAKNGMKPEGFMVQMALGILCRKLRDAYALTFSWPDISYDLIVNNRGVTVVENLPRTPSEL